MPDIYEEIERAKRRKRFDEDIKRVLALRAIKAGVPLNERAALQMIKLRINRDIVLPGINDA